MDFHEAGFGVRLAGENTQGFWFQMSRQQRQQATPPWGTGNPQALNRYSYVNNNPLKYSDPSGHSVYLSEAEANKLAASLHSLADNFRDLYTVLSDLGEKGLIVIGSLVAGIVAKLGLTGVGAAIAASMGSAIVAAAAVGGFLGFLATLYWFAERVDNLADMITDANVPGGAGVAIGSYEKWGFDEHFAVLNRTTRESAHHHKNDI